MYTVGNINEWRKMIVIVYKYYYCGRLPGFLIDYCKMIEIDPVLNINDEFNIDIKEPIYLYAVTNKKKIAKEFIKRRKKDKFIMISNEITVDEYNKFIDITNDIYTIIIKDTSTRFMSMAVTNFEDYFIQNPNRALRSYLKYMTNINILEFLADSKAVDSYLRKCLNMRGLNCMVSELQGDDEGLEELPFSSYETDRYDLYLMLFGFMYDVDNIGE